MTRAIVQENLHNLRNSGRFIRQSRTVLFYEYVAMFAVGIATAPRRP